MGKGGAARDTGALVCRNGRRVTGRGGQNLYGRRGFFSDTRAVPPRQRSDHVRALRGLRTPTSRLLDPDGSGSSYRDLGWSSHSRTGTAATRRPFRSGQPLGCRRTRKRGCTVSHFLVSCFQSHWKQETPNARAEFEGCCSHALGRPSVLCGWGPPFSKYQEHPCNVPGALPR